MRATQLLKASAIVAVVGLATLLSASAASAQGYPSGPTLTLTSTTVPRGTPLGATMTGCLPGQTITFVLNGNPPFPMGSVTAGPTGTGSVTVTVPSTFPAGPTSVTSTCGTQTLTSAVTITATTTTTVTTGNLPTTGSNTDGLVRGGIALVVTGALLTVAATAFARKRGQHVAS